MILKSSICSSFLLVIVLFMLMDRPVINTALLQQQSRSHGGGTHLVILVHGWLGNDKELDYLKETMEKRSSRDQNLIIHNSKCNVGKTSDGIANGGERLAIEVKDQIRQIDGEVILSFVGNSLGGLYARYVISVLDFSKFIPFIFCTIATPHLGVMNNTYIPIPRWFESLIGNTMQQTGQDLFRMNSIIQEMATSEHYLSPLRNFRKRVALANCFGTDFQVPTITAAFLSYDSKYIHRRLPDKEKYFMSLETDPDQENDKKDISQSLDSLGWTKILLDVRHEIPLLAFPTPFFESTFKPEEVLWTSSALIPLLTKTGKSWKVPLGHTVSCANAKNPLYRKMNANGQYIMDQLAADILSWMIEISTDPVKITS
mmetsp:Transcript_32251/g.36686  ORF Transcript_32251/g.36686 Transcript_32251/m.36686 type:complete len:372 (+) Transcript_32251:150-1265(+)